jgi:hypothetical protein
MLALVLARLVLLGPAPEEAPVDARVAVLEPAAVAPGAEVELSVTIRETPEAGAPIELRLSSDDVALTDDRFDARDVVDPHAAQPRLRARVTAPGKVGRYAVVGELRWVVCKDDHCRPQRADVKWTIEVKTQ